MQDSGVRSLMERLEKKTGIKVTPHMLRHTFATRMVDKKAEIKSLSMILGHKKPEFTLKRYVSPDHEQLYSQMMLLSHVGKS